MKLLFTFFSALILFQSLLAGKITWNEKDEATVQSGSGLGVPAEGVTWPTSVDKFGPSTNPFPKPYTFIKDEIEAAIIQAMEVNYKKKKPGGYPKLWDEKASDSNPPDLGEVWSFPIMTSGEKYTFGPNVEPGFYRVLYRRGSGEFVALIHHQSKDPKFAREWNWCWLNPKLSPPVAGPSGPSDGGDQKPFSPPPAPKIGGKSPATPAVPAAVAPLLLPSTSHPFFSTSSMPMLPPQR